MDKKKRKSRRKLGGDAAYHIYLLCAAVYVALGVWIAL